MLLHKQKINSKLLEKSYNPKRNQCSDHNNHNQLNVFENGYQTISNHIKKSRILDEYIFVGMSPL